MNKDFFTSVKTIVSLQSKSDQFQLESPIYDRVTNVSNPNRNHTLVAQRTSVQRLGLYHNFHENDVFQLTPCTYHLMIKCKFLKTFSACDLMIIVSVCSCRYEHECSNCHRPTKTARINRVEFNWPNRIFVNDSER